jgi:hypothetical protein
MHNPITTLKIKDVTLTVIYDKSYCGLHNYFSSDDPKIKAFNMLNWKQKPRRVWDAITGRYFVLGAGTVSSTSLLND